jgi:hypothetical protein
MVADDERKVRNECGAAPWTRNERPVNDEDRQTNRGEEVSDRRITGLPSHARENGPSPAKLIFYRFFYRQRHEQDGKVIAVTEVVSGKTTPVRTSESNVHRPTARPVTLIASLPLRAGPGRSITACVRGQGISGLISGIESRLGVSFLPEPVCPEGRMGRKLLAHRSCSTHGRARETRRCAEMADPSPADLLIRHE